jgi:uncharacterized protein
MILVVLDSNVYISAVVFGGNPRLMLELAENNVLRVLVSYEIKREVERILAVKFSWPKGQIERLATHLWSVTRPTVPRFVVNDCSDPDDNRVLECALQGEAQFIVTGDKHLLDLDPYRGIRILKPKDFLEAAPWQDHPAG